MSYPIAKPLPAGIHVILGDSAGGIFTRVFRARDRMLVDQDVLSCGPTPKCDDWLAWSALRSNYWSSLVPGGTGHYAHSPNNLVEHAQRLRDAERIHIWAATSLSEQLFIAFVIHLAEVIGAEPARIAILQFETLRNRQARILGMGELNEENMGDHPRPAPLTDEVLADYRAAWGALTSPDPTLFERFAADRPAANKWLKQSMQLMTRRFPDSRSGLSHWDLKLLEQCRENGPRAARIIGCAMVDAYDDADLTGDSYLFGRLHRLADARLPRPLLTLSGDASDMRHTEVRLTPFGIDVLEGRASNYPTNPLEDAVGGVMLSSANGLLWFNDQGKLTRGV